MIKWGPICFACLFFLLFRVVPAAYGVFQARVQSELQLPAYTIATATWDPSCVCDLHHSSQQCQIFNTLSEARDGTYNLMVPSQVRFPCATMGTPGPICFVGRPSSISIYRYFFWGYRIFSKIISPLSCLENISLAVSIPGVKQSKRAGQVSSFSM